MTSLSFRKRDIFMLGLTATMAFTMPNLAEARGIPLTFYMYAGPLIIAASVCIDAFFRSSKEKWTLNRSAFERAAPLAALHDRLVQEIAVARSQLADIPSVSEGIEVANAIKGLDRESTVALLRSVVMPNKFDLWRDRIIGFLLGVVGSIFASYLYAFIQSGGNA